MRPTQEQLQESNAQALSVKTAACAVKLRRTSEPIWPDDEQQETTERASQGRAPVPLLGEKESAVALPDRLYAVRALPDDGPAVPRTHGPVGNGGNGSDVRAGTDKGCGDLHPAGDLVGFSDPDVVFRSRGGDADARQLVAGTLGSELELVAGAGHVFPLEAPEVSLGAVLEWLPRRPDIVVGRPPSAVAAARGARRGCRLAPPAGMRRTGSSAVVAIRRARNKITRTDERSDR